MVAVNGAYKHDKHERIWLKSLRAMSNTRWTDAWMMTWWLGGPSGQLNDMIDFIDPCATLMDWEGKRRGGQGGGGVGGGGGETHSKWNLDFILNVGRPYCELDEFHDVICHIHWHETCIHTCKCTRPPPPPPPLLTTHTPTSHTHTHTHVHTYTNSLTHPLTHPHSHTHREKHTRTT